MQRDSDTADSGKPRIVTSGISMQSGAHGKI